MSSLYSFKEISALDLYTLPLIPNSGTLSLAPGSVLVLIHPTELADGFHPAL